MPRSTHAAADLARRWAATGRHVAQSRGYTEAQVAAYWERLRSDSPELLHVILSERIAAAFDGFADAIELIGADDVTEALDPTEVETG